MLTRTLNLSLCWTTTTTSLSHWEGKQKGEVGLALVCLAEPNTDFTSDDQCLLVRINILFFVERETSNNFSGPSNLLPDTPLVTAIFTGTAKCHKDDPDFTWLMNLILISTLLHRINVMLYLPVCPYLYYAKRLIACQAWVTGRLNVSNKCFPHSSVLVGSRNRL